MLEGAGLDRGEAEAGGVVRSFQYLEICNPNSSMKLFRALAILLMLPLIFSCEQEMKLGRTNKVGSVSFEGTSLSNFSNFFQSPRDQRWARDFFSQEEGALVESAVIKALSLQSTSSSLLVAGNHAEAALRWEHDINGDWIPLGYKQKRGYSKGSVSMAVYEKDGAPVLLIVSDL